MAAQFQTGARRLWIGWFPLLSGVPASWCSHAFHAERTSYLLVGLLAGFAWNVVNRRDLVNRLTIPALGVIAGVTAMLVTHSEFEWSDMNTVGLQLIGILAGLIGSEHFLRLRSRYERHESKMAKLAASE